MDGAGAVNVTRWIKRQIGPVRGEIEAVGSDLNGLQGAHVAWCSLEILQSRDELDEHGAVDERDFSAETFVRSESEMDVALDRPVEFECRWIRKDFRVFTCWTLPNVSQTLLIKRQKNADQETYEETDYSVTLIE